MEFDESIDYKALHLDWIRESKFVPKTSLGMKDLTGKPLSYFDSMYTLYYGEHAVFKNNKTAYMFLCDDYKAFKKPVESAVKKVAMLFGDQAPIPMWFITFNFDASKFDIPKVIKDLDKFRMKSWIQSFEGVFEYYTECGSHPHLMMLLGQDKYSKAKLLDKLSESSLAKYTGGKNFIDVRKAEPRHRDYLDLDKCDKKRDYLDKDIIWRTENNIPHKICN